MFKTMEAMFKANPYLKYKGNFQNKFMFKNTQARHKDH